MSAYGFKWRYLEGDTILNESGLWEPLKELTVYCSNGMSFTSCYAATKWLQSQWFPKAQNSIILNCCKGKAKTAYGFHWSYDPISEELNETPIQTSKTRWQDTGVLAV